MVTEAGLTNLIEVVTKAGLTETQKNADIHLSVTWFHEYIHIVYTLNEFRIFSDYNRL